MSAWWRVPAPLGVLILIGLGGGWVTLPVLLLGGIYLGFVFLILRQAEREIESGTISLGTGWLLTIMTGDARWQRIGTTGFTSGGGGQTAQAWFSNAGSFASEQAQAAAAASQDMAARLRQEAENVRRRQAARSSGGDWFVNDDEEPDEVALFDAGISEAEYEVDEHEVSVDPVIVDAREHDDERVAQLMTLRRAGLVELAREQGLATTGTKAQLVERLIEHDGH